MSRQVNNYIIIESSHLFRSGEKYGTQFFVIDVANFLAREVYHFDGPFQTIVLFGSTKEEQAEKYTKSLTRHGIEVIRMNPVESRVDANKNFYKPTLYLHKIFSEIPKKSQVAMVGFHNNRYEELLNKYGYQHTIHVSAFLTKTTKGEWMKIPSHWKELCATTVELDPYADLIKEEFRRGKNKEI